MYDNPGIKDTIKQNWDESSKKYDQSPGHGIHTEKEKEAWKNLLTLAVGSGKQRILDVGTGTGAMAMVLAEMGHDVTGIDLSEGMLNRAKEKAKQTSLPVEFKIGDAEIRLLGRSFSY
jgi:ubiquinone/menaquinone biosynthesis C-methylase UbiE